MTDRNKYDMEKTIRAALTQWRRTYPEDVPLTLSPDVLKSLQRRVCEILEALLPPASVELRATIALPKNETQRAEALFVERWEKLRGTLCPSAVREMFSARVDTAPFTPASLITVLTYAHEQTETQGTKPDDARFVRYLEGMFKNIACGKILGPLASRLRGQLRESAPQG